MIRQKFSKEDIQKFMKRYKLTECFECDGFLFRVKMHADVHSKRNKGAEVMTHAKAVDEKADENKKAKSS